MTAPVFAWSDELEKSAFAPGIKRRVTLTITSDANGQWDAGGYALPSLKGIRLGNITQIALVNAAFWLVGTAGTHSVLPRFDLTTSPPTLLLYNVTDGAEYTQTATNFANKALSFPLEVDGDYEA